MPDPIVFPAPEPLKLSKKEKIEVADTIESIYNNVVQDRTAWQAEHEDYDLMWRGELNYDRSPPWEGASNLHIPMPYWAVDAINTRLVAGIWSQVPLVGGRAEEEDDQETFSNTAHLIDWHLQTKRMNARQAWNRISKIRCIHGYGVGLMPWVTDSYLYRSDETEGGPKLDEEGLIFLDEKGEPVIDREFILTRETLYDGPILQPQNWDDVITPLDWTNLQPVSPKNPDGADFVGIRNHELLSLMWQKRESAYQYIDEDPEMKKRDWWLDNKPSQDNSGENEQRRSLQDRVEGRERNTPSGPKDREDNPQFQTLYWFMPWEVKNEEGKKELQECLFYYCHKPKKLLGAFLLTDINWKRRRPLVELHYQTSDVRGEASMGVCEVSKHLSAELDTIHNMRMDVGFATNMPFFFFRASSGINPENIVLRPLSGVPVDNINDVAFPQLQNVTSFYNAEEQLLYSLVERVLGVTDLFLGISPTRGAAARHATGFVGTQQESLARTSEILNGDAQEFSKLCNLIIESELQFGPDERVLRLQGQEGPITQTLDRKQLWLRGEYDYRVGANEGMYSSHIQQQQVEAMLQTYQINPFLAQDLGRQWEFWNKAYQAYGVHNPELFIGPKKAVAPGSPHSPDEENGQMDQFKFGVGQPAPVHPSDNDQEHMMRHMEHTNSEAYKALGNPNFEGFLAHMQQHQMAMQQKQLMQMQQQAAIAQQGAPAQTNGQPTASNVAALTGLGEMGAMGQMGGGPPVPDFGGEGG